MKWLKVLLIFYISYCSGQDYSRNFVKPLVNEDLSLSWPTIDWIDISNDGKYISYIINNGSSNGKRLRLFDIASMKSREYTCSDRSWFTPDSKNIIWKGEADSLCILSVSDFELLKIPNVSHFILMGYNLIYMLKTPSQYLVIRSIKTNEVTAYESILGFQLTGDLKRIALLHSVLSGSDTLMKVGILELNGRSEEIIWQGERITDLRLSFSGDRAVFQIEGNVVYYWDKRKSSAIRLYPLNMGTKLVITSIVGFSRSGNEVFVTCSCKKKRRQMEPVLNLNIWRYFDRMKGESDSDSKSYLAVVHLVDRSIVCLEQPNEIVYFPGSDLISDTLSLVSYKKYVDNDLGSSGESITCWDLMNTMNGKRIRLDFNQDIGAILISPNLRFVIYYDNTMKSYFSYEIVTGKVRNITKSIKEVWEKNIDKGTYGYKNIAAWEKDDKSVLIYGEYDIWQIDPVGIAVPINLTNGYGLRHRLKFFLALNEYANKSYEIGKHFILSAFSPLSKENGYYRITIGKSLNPDSLTLGPYLYSISDNPYVPFRLNFSPIKARNVEKFVVRRMNSNNAPNFFVTTDFRQFTPVTDLNPHTSFNWYTTELHKWHLTNGNIVQGILYKPENFDSLKKYPIIFSIYERLSDRLNAFFAPSILTGGSSISISYYVSNGYLVFCPDIYYDIGDPMQGAYDAVVSAVQYVSGLPYVNSKKIGIQGSSWGGIQANYLITHTSFFAAACSVSGLGDWISGYGGLVGNGASTHEIYEKGQLRVGATLWEKPEIYIKNSAVFNADKVVTPLLMMHTTNDQFCAFSNALEFFTALRRLGKRAWLLEYEGDHTLFGRDANDFSIRMRQFFDHYLKDAPAPKWMTRSLEPTNFGLELDSSAKTPGEGLNVR